MSLQAVVHPTTRQSTSRILSPSKLGQYGDNKLHARGRHRQPTHQATDQWRPHGSSQHQQLRNGCDARQQHTARPRPEHTHDMGVPRPYTRVWPGLPAFPASSAMAVSYIAAAHHTLASPVDSVMTAVHRALTSPRSRSCHQPTMAHSNGCKSTVDGDGRDKQRRRQQLTRLTTLPLTHATLATGRYQLAHCWDTHKQQRQQQRHDTPDTLTHPLTTSSPTTHPITDPRHHRH